MEIKLHCLMSKEDDFPLRIFKHVMPKLYSEWNGEKGVSNMATKLTEICPIWLPIASVRSEIVPRLMLEINNNTIRNNHIWVSMSVKKLTSFERCKNRATCRLTFKDVVKSTFTLILSESCNSSIPNDVSTQLLVAIPVGNRMATKSSFSVAKKLD